MKMKLILLATLFTLPLQAAVIDNFDNFTVDSVTLTTGNGRLVDRPGWSQTGSNSGPVNVGGVDRIYPLAWVQNISGNQWGALGTRWAPNLASRTTTVSTSLSPTPGSPTAITNSRVAFSLALIDSVSGFPVRDNFGVSIFSGSTELFSLSLTATATAAWELGYSLGGTSATTFGSLLAGDSITPAEAANFALNFYENTVSLIFSTEAGGVVTFELGSFDTSGDLGDIVFSHTHANPVLSGNSWSNSSNYMLFDNIAVTPIPEPSALLLSGFAALGLLRRRRA